MEFFRILFAIYGATFGWSLATEASIVGYDCEAPSTTVTKIDLTEPRICATAASHYSAPVDIVVEVIQTDLERSVEILACKAYTTKVVTRCGLDSISYGSHTSVLRRPIEISVSACRNALMMESLFLAGRAFPIEVNKMHMVEFFSHGALDQNNHCATEAFTSGGIKYDNSYETTRVEYRVRRITARLDSDRDELVLIDGLRVRYSDGQASDVAYGTMSWEVAASDCETGLSKIFHGPAKLFKVDATPTSVLNALVMIDFERRTGGFTLRAVKTTCRRTVFSTQTPGLAILIVQEHERGMEEVLFRPEALSDYLAATTQRDFLYLRSQMSLFQKLAAINRLICENTRAVLFNTLNDAAHGNPYSFRSIFGRGHQILRGSAAAYVIRCAPVDVEVAPFPNCTSELPVRRNGSNRTEFLDALSFTLSGTPTIYPCSDLVESSFKIGSRWLCRSSGSPRACSPPTQLDIDVAGEITLAEDLGAQLGNGLYSAEQLSAHRLFLRTYQARSPIVSKLAAGAIMSVNEAENEWLGLPFDFADRRHLSEIVSGIVDPAVELFGFHFSYIFTGVMVFAILKMIVCLMIRLYVVGKHRGFGFWMCMATFDALVAVAILPVASIYRATVLADRALDDRAGYHHREATAPTLAEDPNNDEGVGEAEQPPPRHDPAVVANAANQVTAAIARALGTFTPPPAPPIDRV